jgi:hypothetical protein
VEVFDYPTLVVIAGGVAFVAYLYHKVSNRG